MSAAKREENKKKRTSVLSVLYNKSLYWLVKKGNTRLDILTHTMKFNSTFIFIKLKITFRGGGGGFRFKPSLSSRFSLKLFLESVSERTTKKW